MRAQTLYLLFELRSVPDIVLVKIGDELAMRILDPKVACSGSAATLATRVAQQPHLVRALGNIVLRD